MLPTVEQQQPMLSDGIRIGFIGVGVLIAMAGAYYVGRKLMMSQIPKVQKVMP